MAQSSGVDADILATLRKASTVRSTDGRCAAARLLGKLPPSLQPTIREAVNDREGIANITLAKWLDGQGFPIAVTTLSAHRAGRCVCGKD